jgi:hypothetical protein
MANTHACTPDGGGASLHLLRGSRCAALVVLAALATTDAAYTQTFTLHPRDLLGGEPEAFVAALEAVRPAPLSAEDIGLILRMLPPTGEVTDLRSQAQRKVGLVWQLLAATRRDWYQVKVIDVPQAVVALHARSVVLISAPALAVLNGAELQALAAHEIGHEYLWARYERARRDADRESLKELELLCDAIAIVTLRKLGMNPSRLIDGIEKIGQYNRERLGTATNESDYPTVAERRTFVQQIVRWSSPLAVSGPAAFAGNTGRKDLR